MELMYLLGDEVAVNADGGSKYFGYPIGASGLRMIFESYLQLQSKAGPEAVEKSEIGVAHNYGGLPAGGVSGVAIVGCRDCPMGLIHGLGTTILRLNMRTNML